MSDCFREPGIPLDFVWRAYWSEETLSPETKDGSISVGRIRILESVLAVDEKLKPTAIVRFLFRRLTFMLNEGSSHRKETFVLRFR